MPSAASICKISSADGGNGWGDDGGGGKKKIKLFGAWVQGSVVRDVSGCEEGNQRAVLLQEEGEHKPLGRPEQRLQSGEARVHGEEQLHQGEVQEKQGENMEEEDPHGGVKNRHGHPQANWAPKNSSTTATNDFRDSQEPRDRNKCIRNQWTAEEHIRFLTGLAKKGKGNWKDISREFVKTRTPTQVATHAQKHFLRQAKPLRRGRSIFDVTLDTGPAREEEVHGRSATGKEGLFLSKSPPDPSTAPAPPPSSAPPRTATAQPRRPSSLHPSRSQPTALAVKVVPFCSEAPSGIWVASILQFTAYTPAPSAAFVPRNVVFTRPRVHERYFG